jgi:hypothetical protein
MYNFRYIDGQKSLTFMLQGRTLKNRIFKTLNACRVLLYKIEEGPKKTTPLKADGVVFLLTKEIPFSGLSFNYK